MCDITIVYHNFFINLFIRCFLMSYNNIYDNYYIFWNMGAIDASENTEINY